MFLPVTCFAFYTLVLSFLLVFTTVHTPLFRSGMVCYGIYGTDTLLIFLIFFQQREKVLREDSEKLRTHFGEGCHVVFLILFITYFYNILTNLLLQHSRISDQNQSVFGGLVVGGHLWLLILFAVVFIPVVKELVFWDIIFNRPYPKNHLLVCLVSMVTLPLLHGTATLTGGKPQDMLAILVYLSLAFFPYRLYRMRKNIIFPVALHFIDNLLTILLLLLLQAVKGV